MDLTKIDSRNYPKFAKKGPQGRFPIIELITMDRPPHDVQNTMQTRFRLRINSNRLRLDSIRLIKLMSLNGFHRKIVGQSGRESS